jgi:hypothetical protein
MQEAGAAGRDPRLICGRFKIAGHAASAKTGLVP